MKQFNIYFGTIGKTLGCRYRYTKWCKDEESAKELTKKATESFYYKNEGKYGIPTYNQIFEESKITGVDVETLYKDHIEDMMRWYTIPTNLDSIPNKKLNADYNKR